ncbi:(2Fe-2S) ferredoxin domain-containing protein [Desmospora activa]|uniref:(2Fe-2S) ferredoxin n=1 Tax=Desmospora activa DSM 45169 TaxID=1121389 RepID=A0A2T4Z9R1_9BACL|nr:(2Fe-2S) ferredoxin domain-containing protein [Desmospora activa]PTM58617.1 hypothetical protein C8J48_1202 [Desmospora activa DSM 45169]
MELEDVRKHVLICNGSTCLKNGGKEVAQAIRAEIKNQAIDDIHTTLTRCNGRCIDACTVITYPDGIWYKKMTPQWGAQLIRCLKKGESLSVSVAYSYDGERFTGWEAMADQEIVSSITPAEMQEEKVDLSSSDKHK